jgi:hypothetical protein
MLADVGLGKRKRSVAVLKIELNLLRRAPRVQHVTMWVAVGRVEAYHRMPFLSDQAFQLYHKAKNSSGVLLESHARECGWAKLGFKAYDRRRHWPALS